MTRRAGYSLFEVLLAFAIMAMVLAVLLPRQSELLGRVANIDERLVALDYARSRLDRLGISEPLEPGYFRENYRDWVVLLDVSNAPLADAPGIVVQRISITIETAEGAQLAQHKTMRSSK